ncbi:hypothetical protein [Nocardia bovistercoris]|uniref:Uncharacterized protein n=1 Tax=Nocardia bovistercoris TaxID=2785916 RepID=A0A931N4Z4_9NOCA|nr:hypothetical protein [Nocardia bovistercoris]MBH0779344.1 hypothetical protein [Nocardia bovistercoris]
MTAEKSPHAPTVGDPVRLLSGDQNAGAPEDPIGEYADLRAALSAPSAAPPVLVPNTEEPGSVSLSELLGAGAVEFHESPPTVLSAAGTAALLTAKDVRLGRPASRRGDATVPGAVTVRAGDIAAVLGPECAVRVIETDGAVLGPGITLIRPGPRGLDPIFLAGILRAALDGGARDLHAVAVPRIPPAGQRRYADAFTRLSQLEDESRVRVERVERILRIGYGGLASGRLSPEA